MIEFDETMQVNADDAEKWNALTPEEQAHRLALYRRNFASMHVCIAVNGLMLGLPPQATIGLATQACGAMLGATIMDPKERDRWLDIMIRVMRRQAELSANEALVTVKPEGEA